MCKKKNHICCRVSRAKKAKKVIWANHPSMYSKQLRYLHSVLSFSSSHFFPFSSNYYVSRNVDTLRRKRKLRKYLPILCDHFDCVTGFWIGLETFHRFFFQWFFFALTKIMDRLGLLFWFIRICLPSIRIRRRKRQNWKETSTTRVYLVSERRVKKKKSENRKANRKQK